MFTLYFFGLRVVLILVCVLSMGCVLDVVCYEGEGVEWAQYQGEPDLKRIDLV